MYSWPQETPHVDLEGRPLDDSWCQFLQESAFCKQPPLMHREAVKQRFTLFPSFQEAEKNKHATQQSSLKRQKLGGLMVDGLEGPWKAWFFWVWVLLVCWFGVGKNFDSSILLRDLNHCPSLLLLFFVWGFCLNCSLGRSESFATPALICYKCISVYFYTCISTLICWPRLLAPLTYTPPHPHIFVFSPGCFLFWHCFCCLLNLPSCL